MRLEFSANLGFNPWLCEQGNTLLQEIFKVELEESRVRVRDLKLNQVEKVLMFKFRPCFAFVFVGVISKAWHLFSDCELIRSFDLVIHCSMLNFFVAPKVPGFVTCKSYNSELWGRV